MLDGEGVVSDDSADAIELLLLVVSSFGVDLTSFSLTRNRLDRTAPYLASMAYARGFCY